MSNWPLQFDSVANIFPGKTSALYFHGVEDHVDDSSIQALHYPSIQFQDLILYLKKRYRILSIDEFYNFFIEKKLPPRSILITFDDGYKNNLYTAAPFLKEHKIPFTVFVSTRHITSGDYFPTFFQRAILKHAKQGNFTLSFNQEQLSLKTAEERKSSNQRIAYLMKTSNQNDVRSMVEDLKSLVSKNELEEIKQVYSSDSPMDWKELAEIPDFGGTVASHCDEHVILHKNQSQQEIDHQLIESKRLIEKYIGPCKYFAFPNGKNEDISEYAIKKLKDVGYLMGFSTEEALVSGEHERYCIPRFSPMTSTDFQFSFNFMIFKSLLSN